MTIETELIYRVRSDEVSKKDKKYWLFIYLCKKQDVKISEYIETINLSLFDMILSGEFK